MQIIPGDWIKFLIWGVVTLLAQIVLTPLLEIRGIRPDLLLIFVLIITFRHGKYAGLAAGFLVGIMQDSFSLDFLGVMALSKSTVAFWSGKWLENREKVLNLGGWFALIAIATFAQDFIAALFALQGSHISMFEYTFRNIIPTAIYTTIIGSLWFLAPFGKTKGTQKFQPRLKKSKW